MNRRGFLTRSGLALGALIVGDEVLETLDRLTHRKVWTGHTFAPRYQTLVELAKAYNSPEHFARIFLGRNDYLMQLKWVEHGTPKRLM